MAQKAVLYDGTSARGHEVGVSTGADALNIIGDAFEVAVPVRLLITISETDQRLRLGRRDIDGWSLALDRPMDPQVSAMVPKKQRYGALIDRIGLAPALCFGAALTAGIVALGYTAPNWLAPRVPMSVERSLGSAVVGDFGPSRCRNPDGQRALEALVERVSPGATKGPDAIKVAALDVSAFNAAALPGGYIVVFKPAITETDPEALAGILAHEVAHVRRRHVTEALIRELGIGAIIRLFAGDIGANAEQLVALSYTRDNEAQADGDAIEMLRRANISPQPTATLFKRLEREAPGYSAEFLQSHPLSGKRAARFADSFSARAHYRPPLSRDQTDALFDICRRGRPRFA